MKPNQSDTTLAELHRIRRELAERFRGDLFALTADAQARTLASGRKVVHRGPAAGPILSSASVDSNRTPPVSSTPPGAPAQSSGQTESR